MKSALCAVCLVIGGCGAAAPLGRRVFADSRNPPSYTQADASARARIDLGHAVFNTQWVVAGTEHAARRDGLGPLFNAAACDACHNEGAHGHGPTGDGVVPVALVIQLELPARIAGLPSTGDPTYGHTLNTAAIEGFTPEATVTVRYDTMDGRYADGSSWRLRAPTYRLSDLRYGPLAARTIVQPRLAPALFGVGLLEAVAGARAGRFGWQGTANSIRDQSTRAFSRDMGLTTTDVPFDDCSPAQHDCRAAANGGNPEVSDEFLAALVEFQQSLAVPARSAQAVPGGADRLFGKTGCAGCHRAQLPVVPRDGDAAAMGGSIDAFTDLALHDLGPALADRDYAGRPVPSRWRTAPLWGLAYRIKIEHQPTFLHDGRARSVEEAILWHGGEAEAARLRFTALPRADRAALVRWIESL